MELLTITKTDLTSLLLKAILEQYFILLSTILLRKRIYPLEQQEQSCNCYKVI